MAGRVCRACFCLINKDEDCTPLRPEHHGLLINVLKTLVADLNTDIVFDAVLCNSCVTLLQVISLYRDVCVENEQKISVYSQRHNGCKKLIDSDLLTIAAMDVVAPKEEAKNYCDQNQDDSLDTKEIVHNGIVFDEELIVKHEVDCNVAIENEENVPLNPFQQQKQTVSHNRKLRRKKKSFVKCPLCEKRCIYKSHLIAHLKLAHLVNDPNRPFLCDLCPKTFTRKFHLERHVYVHTGRKTL